MVAPEIPDTPKEAGTPVPKRAFQVPQTIRFIGWFYLVASAMSFVGGIAQFVTDVRAGTISIAFPVGFGLSTWAIGRGLLHGNKRALRWARAIAAVIPVLVLGMTTVLFTVPAKARLTTPWGSRPVEAWDASVLLWSVSVIAFFTWQFIVLRSKSIRRLYELP